VQQPGQAEGDEPRHGEQPGADDAWARRGGCLNHALR
jgi:hypothetical protein